MDQERKVHETALSAGATAAVIPFPVTRERANAAGGTAVAAAEAPVGQEEELGDNVELF
jgi:hypothetical protein